MQGGHYLATRSYSYAHYENLFGMIYLGVLKEIFVYAGKEKIYGHQSMIG